MFRGTAYTITNGQLVYQLQKFFTGLTGLVPKSVIIMLLAFVIGVIANGLNLLNVQQGPQRFVKGLIIILAVVIEAVKQRKAKN